MSMTFTPSSGPPGADLSGKVMVHNFELTGEAGHTHTEAAPQNAPGDAHPQDSSHDEAAECPGGHVHVYFDDLMTEPLTQAVTSEFTIKLPADATAGTHTIMGRLHNRDHTIYTPEVIEEVEVTVE